MNKAADEIVSGNIKATASGKVTASNNGEVAKGKIKFKYNGVIKGVAFELPEQASDKAGKAEPAG